MRFITRKRKQTPTIIIVALIDVLIVLLIFLMVTTTFKQQPAIRIALPESSQSHKPGADEKAPLIVSVDAKGTIRLGNDSQPVTEDRLKTELVSRAEKDPDLKLAISSDKSAPFGQVVKVLDAVRAANIKMVSAFTLEPAKP